MSSDTKVSRLILQLTKATVDEGLEWVQREAPRSITMGTDDLISFFLTAEYKGKDVALYERRYRSYDGEHDAFFWIGDDAIAILDGRNELLWESRGASSALANLIQVARDSAAKVDELLDSLLD